LTLPAVSDPILPDRLWPERTHELRHHSSKTGSRVLSALNEKGRLRKLYLFLSILGVAVLATSAALWSPTAQQPPSQNEIKKQRRDARYSRQHFSITNMEPGTVERSITDFVEPDDYFAKKPDGTPMLTAAQKAAIEQQSATAATAKRKALTCAATVAVTGRVKSRQGFVTSDDSNIYTVYQFTVQEILRATQGHNIGAGQDIEVTVRGGFAKNSRGHLVGVEDPHYPPLTKNNTHILVLKHDPEAGDYYPTDPIGMYRITDDGRIMRGDAKSEFKLRRAMIVAREPNTVEAVTSELRSTTCQ
jgi:hypothetical protein